MKLSKLRLRRSAVVRQGRVFKQSHEAWTRKQQETLKLMVGRSRLENVDLGKRFEKVQRRFAKQHRAVQEVKLFYGGLKTKELRKAVLERGQSYKRRVRQSTKPNRGERERALVGGSSLVSKLESRLQRALYRRLLCPSMKSRRQAIAHGHVRVNGKVERRPSFMLKSGDLVKLDAKVGNLGVRVELTRGDLWSRLPFRCPPGHLEVRLNQRMFVFVDVPYGDEVWFPFDLDVSAVRNYYGRG